MAHDKTKFRKRSGLFDIYFIMIIKYIIYNAKKDLAY